LNPFVCNYYVIDKAEKARQVFEQTAQIHREYLDYYASLDLTNQLENLEEIYSKMNQYEGLVLFVYAYDEPAYYMETRQRFMDDVAQFKALFERVGVDIEKEFLRTKPRESAQDLDSKENSMLDPEMSPDAGSEMSTENSMP